MKTTKCFPNIFSTLFFVFFENENKNRFVTSLKIQNRWVWTQVVKEMGGWEPQSV